MADDVAWIAAVKNSGVVTVDASKVTHPQWKLATAAAIQQLNTLFASNHLNVKLQTGDSAVLTVALSSGKYKFPVDGQDQEGTLRSDILHGVTRSVDRYNYNDVNREHAYIFLPEHPKTDPQNAKSRDVGEPVMGVIVAHEFIHALGLHKHDPAFEGLFAGTWQLNEGDKPKDDTVSPFGGRAKLPPLVLSSSTWKRLKALW